MPVILPPVSPATHRLLRAGVLSLRQQMPRGRFSPRFCVGVPGRLEHQLVVTAGFDHGLRTEACVALLDAALDDRVEPIAWLTRPGSLETADLDLAWLAASLAAFAELDADPTMVVMTPRGWRDPRSGTNRTWARLRPRS